MGPDVHRQAALPAIVDRPTFEAHIIETGTRSFPFASTTAERKAAAAA
ncbi:hypothetical protein [Kitasatospora sp. NPDC093679]